MVAPGLLPPAPLRTPIGQGDGTFSNSWKNWFAQLYDKIGGVGTSSFTPIFLTDGTIGTPSYSTQSGRFTTIGTLRVAEFSLALSNWTGSPSGNVLIGGLPQNFVTDSAGVVGFYSRINLGSASYAQMGIVGVSGQTYARLYGMGSGTGVASAQIPVSGVATNAAITGSIIYSV